MIEGLRSLLDIIGSLLEFIGHSITSLFDLISNIPTYTVFLINSINVLPSVIIPFAIASVSLYVVFLITGRQG